MTSSRRTGRASTGRRSPPGSARLTGTLGRCSTPSPGAASTAARHRGRFGSPPGPGAAPPRTSPSNWSGGCDGTALSPPRRCSTAFRKILPTRWTSPSGPLDSDSRSTKASCECSLPKECNTRIPSHHRETAGRSHALPFSRSAMPTTSSMQRRPGGARDERWTSASTPPPPLLAADTSLAAGRCSSIRHRRSRSNPRGNSPAMLADPALTRRSWWNRSGP